MAAAAGWMEVFSSALMGTGRTRPGWAAGHEFTAGMHLAMLGVAVAAALSWAAVR
jgi:hypothetical protein